MVDYTSGLKTAQKVLRGSLEGLGLRKSLINNLNVFPVPDGDTGTNMYLTMRAGLKELERSECHDPAAAANAFARGALRGSRGNSGFILAQFLDGFAEILSEASTLRAPVVASSIRNGVERAFQAVDKPLEGTMLTVMKDASYGISIGDDWSGTELLLRVYSVACDSLRRTPRLLKALADAGTVDAGGAGIVAALEGCLDSLEIDIDRFEWGNYEDKPIPGSYMGPPWGVQFSFACDQGRLDGFRREMKGIGESVVLAGHAAPYRFHIHTDRPEIVLERARATGRISGLEVVRLDHQVADYQSGESRHTYRLGVVSLCEGPEMTKLFEETGSLVLQWSTSPPETELLADMVESLDCELALVIPNDQVLVPVAESIAARSRRSVSVLQAVSPVQGLSALEEYIEDGEPDDVISEMREAASRVRFGVVMESLGNSPVAGGTSGQTFYDGTAEGEPVCSTRDISNAAARVCSRLAEGSRARLVTLISGSSLKEEERNAISDMLSRELAGADLEWYEGGQRSCLLHIGVE